MRRGECIKWKRRLAMRWCKSERIVSIHGNGCISRHCMSLSTERTSGNPPPHTHTDGEVRGGGLVALCGCAIWLLHGVWLHGVRCLAAPRLFAVAACDLACTRCVEVWDEKTGICPNAALRTPTIQVNP